MNSTTTILIVDDNLENLKLCGILIQSMGYKSRIAFDGERAIESALQNPPDLILLDIHMPGIDGYETCRQMKSHVSLRNIPIIFLSALDQEIDKTRAFEAGCVDYLTKPLSLGEAKVRINTHLQISFNAISLRNYAIEQKQASMALKKQEEKLNQLTLKQQELLQIISHDLSNPLSNISLATELLEQEHGSNPVIKSIRKSVDMSIDLITSVRDMQRLGIKKPVLAPVSVREIIDDSFLVCKERFVRKEIKFRSELENGEVKILANAQVLNISILPNLFTNAIKFSDPGNTVTVLVREEAGSILIAVCDEGIGMPADALKHLFDIGKSKSRSGTQKETGTGFGMPLVKSAVETLGGSIHVTSSERRLGKAHGTTVTLLFPKA